MYMLGFVPHSLPLTKKLQSADNVEILCLAKAKETSNVIANALPSIGDSIRTLQTEGIALDYARVNAYDMEPPEVNVEFHLAADLSALWLALGLDNFTCIYCEAGTHAHMNNVNTEKAKRILSDTLGIPPERIHLCALHAQLRIVERLVKNAASRAYSRDNVRNNRRGAPRAGRGGRRSSSTSKATDVDTLSKFLAQELNRDDLNITPILGKQNEVHEDLLERGNILLRFCWLC